MPKYYMFECTGEDEMLTTDPESVGNQSWFSGRPFETQVEEPVEVEVVNDGEPLVYFSDAMLMRADLVECIQAAGVDNLEVFDAVIRDTEHGIDYDDYKAVNVIGVVACADPDETEYYSENPSRLVDADIESLVIDESKARGLLLFRLAECITGLVVHEKVKDAIEAAGFEDVEFYDPKDWVG